ncbi:F-box/kelch-repeat protein At3g06240-like isoform X3 [Cornus florida]|uniref:F-box/kelch-repeat protein At3g06240-like isoform X3 n=1 Tax=Cornus florida TaxID=4283 RepID=UPI002897CAA9|nr:F-box/kelch-repeat protein At3g06240-like isoform X3 [Cornus florida]
MATDNEIPVDVIIDILLRLPVVSLIRARVVCKNWYTIIKNPSFVTNHFNHHTNNSGRLFVHRLDIISHKFIFSLFPDETLAGSPLVYEDMVVDMPHYLGISLYNGILCLSNHFRSNHFALWNPATREFRSLPMPSHKFPHEETFGFGLDPITNDYKVIWIWKTLDDVTNVRYGPYQVAVYTLSTDSWRYLDFPMPYSDIDTPPSNTCINGVYHWFAIHNDHRRRVILSFDMGNELVHEIRDIPSSKPAVLAPYNNNNSLALMCRDYDSSVVDIWVMIEEGCWTKQFTVQLLSKHKLPLGFWKNGQLFMGSDDDDTNLALYDLETHEIKHLGSLFLFNVLVYKESLVTIRGRDGFLEQDQLSDVDKVLNFSK